MILVNTVQNHKKHKEILLNLIDEFAGVNDTRIYDLQVASSVQTIVPNMTSDWSIEKDAKREYLEYFYNHVIYDIMENFGYLLGLSRSNWNIINGWYMQYGENGEHDWHNHINSGHFTNVYFLELPDSEYKTQLLGRDGKILEYEAKEGDVVSIPSWQLHRSPKNGPKRKTTLLFNSEFEFIG